MRIFPKILFVLLIIGISASGRDIAAGSESPEVKVQSVEVQLVVAGTIYEGLQDRIEFSIGRVGEKILLSQPLSILQRNQDTVKAAIFNVFSKVLTGFKLDAVDLSLGQHTKVVIQLTPIPPLIAAVRLRLEIKDVAPEMLVFAGEFRDNIETELNRILIGLPVASVAWSEGSINLAANYLAEREFPGFVPSFAMKAGAETNFILTLEPNEPTVASVKTVYNSRDLPAWIVKSKSPHADENFSILKGLPVEFVSHYQKKLERFLLRRSEYFPELQRLGISTRLSVSPSETTTVKLDMESQVVRTKLEARYFIDNNDSFANLHGYLGYHTGDSEWFIRKYWGSYPGGDTKIGILFPMGSNLSGAFEYDLNDEFKDLWFHFRFERGDYLDLTLGLDDGPNEALVGIFLNKHINLEFVKFDNRFGVQLMYHY